MHGGNGALLSRTGYWTSTSTWRKLAYCNRSNHIDKKKKTWMIGNLRLSPQITIWARRDFCFMEKLHGFSLWKWHSLPCHRSCYHVRLLQQTQHSTACYQTDSDVPGSITEAGKLQSTCCWFCSLFCNIPVPSFTIESTGYWLQGQGRFLTDFSVQPLAAFPHKLKTPQNSLKLHRSSNCADEQVGDGAP